MTPVDSPHVLLTRAADKLQLLAAHWTHYERGFAEQEPMPHGVMRWDSPSEMWLYDLADRNASRSNARWATTLSPAVAPHLVAWLRAASSNYAANADWYPERSPERLAAMADPMARYALRFARLVLGMEAETP